MLVSARHLGGTDLAADVVVVGAGAVGLSLAVEIAGAGKSVVLLEAGGEVATGRPVPLFDSAVARGYPLDGLKAGRARALGGTTNLWAGQLATLEPIIFERRPWVADAAWPLSAEDLEPACDRAFDVLGLGDRLCDEEVAQRLAIDQPTDAPDLEFFFTRWVPEVNFARLFRRAIQASSRLTVVIDAPVVALCLSDDRRTIKEVRIRVASGRALVARASDFVLANGTIEIARLLSVPVADGAPAPWAANAWLGRGYMDHIDAYAGEVALTDAQRFHALFDSGFVGRLKYKPKLRLSQETQRQERLVSAIADFVCDSAYLEELRVLKSFARSVLKGRPDRGVMRTIADRRGSLAGLARVSLPMIARYVRHRRTYNPGDRGIYLRLSTEQVPLSGSRLRLLPEADALGMPTAEVEWAIDGEEVRAMATLSEAVAAFLTDNGIAHVALNKALKARSRDFLATIDDANHQMGMTRMAERAEEGVVDRDLKVFGTRNLYVAGAAVFPTAGAANPTFTAIALGLRLAAKLLA
jgi:choline dehydrogenase-like flavoprotein